MNTLKLEHERWRGTVCSYHTGGATKHEVVVCESMRAPTRMYEWVDEKWATVKHGDPLCVAILTGWALSTEIRLSEAKRLIHAEMESARAKRDAATPATRTSARFEGIRSGLAYAYDVLRTPIDVAVSSPT